MLEVRASKDRKKGVVYLSYAKYLEEIKHEFGQNHYTVYFEDGTTGSYRPKNMYNVREIKEAS